MSNLSESYKRSYGQVANPAAGARVPAGKDDTNNTDSLRQSPNVPRFGKARDLAGKVRTSACRKAAVVQGAADNNKTQANSGCNSEK